MSLVKHEKKRTKQWFHKGCGGEVHYEATGPGFRWTKLPGQMPVKVAYQSQSGYKCSVCGFISKSEVESKPIVNETWEW